MSDIFCAIVLYARIEYCAACVVDVFQLHGMQPVIKLWVYRCANFADEREGKTMSVISNGTDRFKKKVNERKEHLRN